MSGQEMSGPQLLEFIGGSKTPFAGLPVLDCNALAGTEGLTPERGSVCVMSSGLVPVGTDMGTGVPKVAADFKMAGQGNIPGVAPTTPKYGLH